MLRYLPNALTTLRLLLALPLGVLILREQYSSAVAMGLAAGLTDALDGFAARKLHAQSQLGAMLDPIADKTLVTATFLCLAQVGVIPWPVAMCIVGRDLVIVAGAACYRLFVGPFKFGARPLSKLNMVLQIGFCVLLLAAQITPVISPAVLLAGTWTVIVITLVSGVDYIQAWSRSALRELGARR
ncbi:CDP-alcohol phosphatidyltransferase family protein [Halioglobus maricola]|uniref:CDP-diacylglycerol--glycerol-3-phosphate 3-phosphatidyltransferase n=1 Tax=Halioglobus maricola TaxID=2601894 RepID=A0A5P9NLF4_9GAMM|nr:CDP-alcohol phosphatidyltransferase family protein [Halioglobus maricola]QFU76582.1 CDP-alcohol phosphatidyltransferase family protein [Halioglobus maricola]